MSLAECQLVGGAFFDHLQEMRADEAGAVLRAVSEVPSPATALQNAKRFRRVHCQRVERAMSSAGQALDSALGRDLGEAVTVDLDATQVTVYGRKKEGAARCRTGADGDAPDLAFWAQRGRTLCGLVGGNRERLTGASTRRSPHARSRCCPAAWEGHDADRLRLLRDRTAGAPAQGAHTLHGVRAAHPGDVEHARADPRERLDGRLEMPGAQVAETTYRPGGWNTSRCG